MLSKNVLTRLIQTRQIHNMKRTALLVFAILSLYSCGSDTNSTDNTDAVSDSATTSTTEASENGYYKRYTGTIANVPIVLNLIKSGNSFRGTYYYQKIGSVLNVYGMDRPDSLGMIMLGEEAPTERDEEATGHKWMVVITDSTIKGKWVSESKDKEYAVDLVEDYTGAIPLGILYHSDSMRYIDTLPDPEATCQLQYLIPATNDEKARYLVSAMRNILVCKDDATDFRQCMDAKKQEYFSTYKADMKDVEDQGLLQGSYSYNFSWAENHDVYYNTNDWLCICVVDWSYTGGAHGNYSSQYHCIDIKEQKEWQLKDILADTVKIVPLIEKNVRKQFSISPKQALNSRLFVDEMYATNNFFITDKGITFVYTSYEIASYADGEVSVFIPFDSIKDILTPAFNNRMGFNTTAKAI